MTITNADTMTVGVERLIAKKSIVMPTETAAYVPAVEDMLCVLDVWTASMKALIVEQHPFGAGQPMQSYGALVDAALSIANVQIADITAGDDENENVDGGDDGGAYDAVEPGRRMAALSMLSEMFDGYRNVTVDSVSDALNLAAIIDASVVKSGGLLPMKKAVAAAAALPTIDELVVEHLGDSGDDTACATSVVVPSYALLPTTAVVDCCPMSVDDVSVAAAFGGDDTGAFSLADYGFDSLFDVGGDKAAYDALSGQIGLLGDDSMTAYLDCSALADVASVAFVTDAALAVTDDAVAAFVVTETAVVSEIAAVDESEAVIVAEIESESAVVSEIVAVANETVAVSETIIVTVIPTAFDVTETSAVVAVVAVAAPRPNKGGSGGGGKRAHVRCNRDETCDETDETDAPNQCSICCGTAAVRVHRS